MNALVQTKASEIIEAVITKGDIARLSPEERSRYYVQVCESVGLNPMTRPFEYITLNNKLTLYARKDCTDQLRAIHNVSVTDLIESERDGVYVVTAKVINGAGRSDAAKGAVSIGGLKGEALANALMKAETKAKRRATLSICGLGFLDETEVEDLSEARVFNATDAKRVNPHVNRAEDMVDVPAIGDPDRIPNGDPGIKSLPKKNTRDDFAKWQKELHAITDEAQVLKWLQAKATADRVQTYPSDWQEIARGLGKQHLSSIRAQKINGHAVAPAMTDDGLDISDPEKALKWIDDKLASFSDPFELNDCWNDVIAPRLEGMFPPDQTEAMGLYRKHELRLAP